MGNPSLLKRTSDKSVEGVGRLVKLLPTTTVLLFQVLGPVVTGGGHDCDKTHKGLTLALLGVCGGMCYMSTFTDSFRDENGRLHYGFATVKGLWVFDGFKGKDLSHFKLTFGDFVHAALSVMVFLTVALVDKKVVGCLYPSIHGHLHEYVLDQALPATVGAACSVLFLLFPSKRHGIGYPPPPISPQPEPQPQPQK